MKFRYIEKCAKGYVEFTRGDEVTTMETGEIVQVPDWLAAKLSANDHFEQVTDDGVAVSVRKGWPKGKSRKPVAEQVTSDADGT